MERQALQPDQTSYAGPPASEEALLAGDVKSWWRDGLPALHRRVDDVGSVARSHLANERTWLAWLRTSVSLVALGLALAKFSPDADGVLGGSLMIGLGGVLLWYSGFRYFAVAQGLEAGYFRINVGGVASVLVGATVLVIACITLVVRAGIAA